LYRSEANCVEIGEKIGEKKEKRDRDRGAGDKQRAHERPRKKHSKHWMDEGTYMRMIYMMTKTKKRAKPRE